MENKNTPFELDVQLHDLHTLENRLHGVTKQNMDELSAIELAMQNKELFRGQIEVEDKPSRYFLLSRFAPEGYCTVDKAGMVLDVNRTIETMLGMSPCALNEILHYV